MIPKLYTAAFISLTALLSCGGSNNNDYVDKSLITSAGNKTADTTPVTQPAPQIINAQPANTVPATNTVNIDPAKVNPQTVTTTQPVTQPTAAGMNPPHGQPGHRCDISVGAPLNSKPAQTPAANISTSQPQVQTATQTATQPTAPGMNPPHGQPNHRCDIAVGAPLNSKPTQPATPAISVSPAAKPDSAKN